MTLRQRFAAEQGLTLIELVIVCVIVSILLGLTVTSYVGYRVRGNNATARANVHVLLPAIETYHAEKDTYVGMTLLGLKLTYDQSIDPSMYKLTSLTDTDYCLSSEIGGQAWKRTGPGTDIVAGECP